jgi:hypothetical protein
LPELVELGIASDTLDGHCTLLSLERIVEEGNSNEYDLRLIINAKECFKNKKQREVKKPSI